MLTKSRHLPSWTTFQTWCSRNPEVKMQFEAAMAQRAVADVLDMQQEGRDLLERGKAGMLHKDEVAAVRLYADLERWVAGKFHPKRFGEQREMRTVVPIQIVTTLDFGQEGAQSSDQTQSEYVIDLKPEEPSDDEPQGE
jgi:hypothetical protein